MTFDPVAKVKAALDAAKAAGLTGWHLEWGAAKRLEVHKIDVDTAAGLDRQSRLGEAFRAVVWPETRGEDAAHAGGLQEG